MLIIFNLSGALVAIFGFFIGLAAAIVTRQLWFGVLITGALWIALALFWRSRGHKLMYKSDAPPVHPLDLPPDPPANVPAAPAQKMRWPSIFFIPMPIWGALLLLFVLPTSIFLQRAIANRVPDPREARLFADQATLKSNSTAGDQALSTELLAVLNTLRLTGAGVEDAAAFTRIQPDSVLVLAQISNLSKFSDNAKTSTLAALADALARNDKLSGRRHFIGIRGKLLYGAARSPQGERLGALSEQLLLNFYGDPPPPPSSSKPTPK